MIENVNRCPIWYWLHEDSDLLFPEKIAKILQKKILFKKKGFGIHWGLTDILKLLQCVVQETRSLENRKLLRGIKVVRERQRHCGIYKILWNPWGKREIFWENKEDSCDQ